MLLASLGVYGLVAQSVAQRTREIGICLALGATTQHVIRSVSGDPLTLLTVGLLVLTSVALAGLLPALRLSRLDPAQTLRNE